MHAKTPSNLHQNNRSFRICVGNNFSAKAHTNKLHTPAFHINLCIRTYIQYMYIYIYIEFIAFVVTNICFVTIGLADGVLTHYALYCHRLISVGYNRCDIYRFRKMLLWIHTDEDTNLCLFWWWIYWKSLYNRNKRNIVRNHKPLVFIIPDEKALLFINHDRWSVPFPHSLSWETQSLWLREMETLSELLSYPHKRTTSNSELWWFCLSFNNLMKKYSRALRSFLLFLASTILKRNSRSAGDSRCQIVMAWVASLIISNHQWIYVCLI